MGENMFGLRRHRNWAFTCTVAAAAALASPALAQDDSQELAKKLSNPIADLISVPFQYNYDCCFGLPPGPNGVHHTVNIQPVIPIKLNPEWNMIVRTIIPVSYWEHPAPTVDDIFGLGDITQSFFFSPTAPTSTGIIWGAGPAFLYPSSTDPALGSRQWGAGPTAVMLKQESGWTYGVLANHIWSLGSPDIGQTRISNTFIQPFLNYTFPDTFGITLNTESTYNWVTGQWTVPINLTFSKIFRFGKLPVSLLAGPRYYAVSPKGGPDWGVRFAATLMFPTK